MNIPAIKNAVVFGAHRGALIGQKHSPAILTGTGIVTGVAAAVLGARATLGLEEIVDETNERVVEIKNIAALQDLDVKNKDVTKEYVKGGLKVAKLYGPAVSLGVVSIGLITGGHVVNTKRNVALMGSYAALERTYNEYRKRVEVAVGADKEREIRVGDVSAEAIQDLVKDKSSTEAKTALHMTERNVSPYARFFDDYSTSWSGDADQNKIFLLHQQNYFNDLLRVNGHVFLNDVYKALGMSQTPQGQLVGWLYDPKDQTGTRDNFVDFGIFEKDAQTRKFVAGFESAVLLDFNVDGIIYDLLEG